MDEAKYNIEFKHLQIGERFLLDDIKYIKTNHLRGYRIINKKKELISIKKNKLVLTYRPAFIGK